MKRLNVVAALFASGAMVSAGQAFAACSDPQLTGSQLAALLPGKYACAPDGRPEWGWKYQELHVAGGSLQDYKKGPGHAVDPSKTVGTWSVSGDTVQYSYVEGGTTSGPFSHTVHNSGGGAYSVCQSGAEVATLQEGSNGCVAGGVTSTVLNGQSAVLQSVNMNAPGQAKK